MANDGGDGFGEALPGAGLAKRLDGSAGVESGSVHAPAVGVATRRIDGGPKPIDGEIPVILLMHKQNSGCGARKRG